MLAAPVLADAPKTSLRPVTRPAGVIVVQAAPVPVPEAPVQATTPPAVPAPAADAPTTPAPAADTRARLRPQARPAGLVAAAPRPDTTRENQAETPGATPGETRAERRARERAARQAGGGLCGDPALAGEVIGRVPGPGGCGIDNAVRLRAVAGIRLSTPATLDCTTAAAIKRWVERGVIPEVGNRGGGVTELRVAASYACRGRNNQKGARLSEHARGHAIDISGLTLRDGSSLTVLRDWGSGRNGRLMKSLHRAACGPFGTVLGPNSDRYHRDHFHFDTARYRSGPYCK